MRKGRKRPIIEHIQRIWICVHVDNDSIAVGDSQASYARKEEIDPKGLG
jgi:hypothetical protein